MKSRSGEGRVCRFQVLPFRSLGGLRRYLSPRQQSPIVSAAGAGGPADRVGNTSRSFCQFAGPPNRRVNNAKLTSGAGVVPKKGRLAKRGFRSPSVHGATAARGTSMGRYGTVVRCPGTVCCTANSVPVHKPKTPVLPSAHSDQDLANAFSHFFVTKIENILFFPNSICHSITNTATQGPTL